MATHAVIAKALGVSQPTVSKYVKQGCPTDSVEAAEAWFAARGGCGGSRGGKPNSEQLAKRKALQLALDSGLSIDEAVEKAKAVRDPHEKKKDLEAIKLQLQIYQMQGRLVERSQIEEEFRAWVQKLVGILESWPPKVSQKIVGQTERQVYEILAAAVRQLREDLACA